MKSGSFIALLLLSVGSLSFAASESPKINIDEVISLAKKESDLIKASEKALESLEAEIRARDLLLSPTLKSELAMFNDHRRTFSTGSGGTRNTSGLLDVSLTIPLATGTKFSLNVSHDLVRSDSFARDQYVSAWEAVVSQSLWRDSFGNGTRLRREAEQSELLSRQYSLLLDRQQHLIEIENAYWNLALAIKEIEVRNQTIERSTALEKWVRRRMGRYAAEQSDLLQVQGLLSQRQLDLTAARNRFESAMNSVRALIPGSGLESWTVQARDLEQERNIRQMLALNDSTGEPVLLSALVSRHRALQAETEAKRVSDSLKPQLDAYVSYGANGIEEGAGRSWDRARSADYDAARVGLLLSVELDQGLKTQRRKSARLNAEAEAYRAAALTRQSKIGWSDLTRNIENLKIQVKEARELSTLQGKKVRAERLRYEQGRATAFQITTFEVDAAESELRLYRVLADLRKAEASARAFIIPFR